MLKELHYILIYKGKLNPFYPMDEATTGAFQKVDSINYWKIRGEEALGGK